MMINFFWQGPPIIHLEMLTGISPEDGFPTLLVAKALSIPVNTAEICGQRFLILHLIFTFFN